MLKLADFPAVFFHICHGTQQAVVTPYRAYQNVWATISDRNELFEQFFFAKYLFMIYEEWTFVIKRGKKHGTVPKITVFPRPLSQLKWGIPQNRNSQNEGSLKIEIPKSRDPSKQEFLKWGKYTLLQFFARNIKLLSMFFSGTRWFTNSKLHRRIFNACSVGQIFDY